MNKQTTFLCYVFGMLLLSCLPTLGQELQGHKQTMSLSHRAPQVSTKTGHSTLRTAGAETMGTLTLFMREDFSLMTAGSENAPDMDGTICAPDGMYKFRVWENIDQQYTHWRGWGAYWNALTFEGCQGKGNAHSAGGMIHIGGKEGGKLNTPRMDLRDVTLHEDDPTSQNVFAVRFRMRALKEIDPNLFAVHFITEAAETTNYADSDNPTYDGNWKICHQLTPDITEISTEWNTYEIVFSGAGHSTLVNIAFMVFPKNQDLADDVRFDLLFDDFEVYKVKPFLRIPDVKPHSNMTTDSFVANWKPVEGATGYLVDVYCMVPDMDAEPNGMGQYPLKRQDILSGEKCSQTSLKVTGIDSELVYYYNVRAVKDEQESYRSPDQEVLGVPTPILDDVDQVIEGHYAASWNKVPGVVAYQYLAYHERVADEATEMVIVDDHFTGVAMHDGKPSGYTEDNPSDGYTYTRTFPSDLSIPGWDMRSYVPYTDFIAFDGWQYINHGTMAGMISPDLDLSHNNGRVTVSMKLYGCYSEETNQFTQAAVALFNYNEEIGDYEQVELVYPAKVAALPITSRWQNYTVTLTKGSKNCAIGIFAVKAPAFLYLDDLKITQRFNAGDSYLAPVFGNANVVDNTFEVVIPAYAKEDALYHRVCAVKAIQEGMGSSRVVIGNFSELKQVQKATSTQLLPNIVEPKAYRDGEMIRIVNPNQTGVYIYDVTGALVYSAEYTASELSIKLPQESAYIVRMGEVSIKVY